MGSSPQIDTVQGRFSGALSPSYRGAPGGDQHLGFPRPWAGEHEKALLERKTKALALNPNSEQTVNRANLGRVSGGRGGSQMLEWPEQRHRGWKVSGDLQAVWRTGNPRPRQKVPIGLAPRRDGEEELSAAEPDPSTSTWTLHAMGPAPATGSPSGHLPCLFPDHFPSF